ncbi:MAG: hypothetical protein LUC91_05335 [Prevotella sp.]|nr:hypothetical protein [Prevotella sp.]
MIDKKETIKRLIGPIGVEAVRKVKMVKNLISTRLSGTYGRCDVTSPKIMLKDTLSIRGKNIFFGYYDLQQMDTAQNRLLVHICNRNADTRKDAVTIAYYDMKRHEYEEVAQSNAWSWQQGCRLRWNPQNENEIMFNNLEDGKYVCQLWNVDNKEKIKTIPIPLYDVDRQMRYGVGVNFSRLQRLRPGYGYSTLPDKTAGQHIPDNDGIFRYDFQTGGVSLIISYKQLCKDFPNAKDYQHYINHISISPDGKRFIFFHVYTKGPGMSWKVRLYVSDINGTDISLIEEEHTISHYTWKDDSVLLTTCINKGGNSSCYAEYDIRTKQRKQIGGESLILDGHPTFLIGGKSFISDTYPQKGCMQHLFLYNMEKNEYQNLVDVFHNPRLYEEKRCDLHPRITPDNKYFTIDSVYSSKCRSILLFELLSYKS